MIIMVQLNLIQEKMELKLLEIILPKNVTTEILIIDDNSDIRLLISMI